jgi:nucleoside-specific outer membrane channel protein Tsx
LRKASIVSLVVALVGMGCVPVLAYAEKSASGLSSLSPDAQCAILAALERNGSGWIQQAELTASDGAVDDGFGSSVAVSGSTAVVGAPFHMVGSNAWQGAAYVFVESGGKWTQQAELIASDGTADDKFGSSVAVSGGTVVVGAFQHTVGSNTFEGAAYVFVESGGTWRQQAELTASDGATYDEFGNSVAVSGSTAVVGAFEHAVGSNASQGVAYVFEQNGTKWIQQAELTASDAGFADEFGESVAVSGSTVVVGSPEHTVGSNYTQGAGYVFTDSGGTWNQQAELTASNGGASDYFGLSVAVDGGTVVVGGDTGVYAFSQSGETWSQQPELTVYRGVVAVGGSTIVAGVPVYQQVAYVFGENAGTWSQQAELTSSDGSANDLFGDSVAVSGSTVLVGAFQHTVGSNQGQGAAYVFEAPAIAVTLTPTTLSFGNQAVNTTSATKTVTLKNTGTGTLTISGVGASTDFEISKNTCGATLAAGKTCKVSITFTPTELGSVSGMLTFTDNAPTSPQTMALSGTGIADATLTPAKSTYAKQAVGTTSAAKPFKLTNNQSVELTGIAISTSGDFAVSATTCGTSLAAKGKCTISVTFTPTEAGTRTGELKVSDSGSNSNSPQTSNLKGTGE